jgi:hypothetical protein
MCNLLSLNFEVACPGSSELMVSPLAVDRTPHGLALSVRKHRRVYPMGLRKGTL